MSVELDHPVVAAYLDQLDRAATAAGLSGGRRAELRAEIRAHVHDALAAEPELTDPVVSGVLDRLGPVEEIVAAEGTGAGGVGGAGADPQAPPPPPSLPPPGAPPSWGALEYVALALLTVGQVVLPVVGPVAGVACAWASTHWSRGGKIAATVLGVLVPLLVVLAAAAVWLTAGGSSVEVGPVPASTGFLPPPTVTAGGG